MYAGSDCCGRRGWNDSNGRIEARPVGPDPGLFRSIGLHAPALGTVDSGRGVRARTAVRVVILAWMCAAPSGRAIAQAPTVDTSVPSLPSASGSLLGSAPGAGNSLLGQSPGSGGS